MSLESCPVCGYAVSTVDSRCRHCAVGPRLENQHGWWISVGFASLVALGWALYFHFIR